MKIKNDFVTNSSSTNFFFIFKGPRCVKSVVDAVRNHKTDFNLSYELDADTTWSCTHEDIINDIEKNIKSSLGKNEWNSLKITTIDKEISEVEKYIEDEKQTCDSWMKDSPDDKNMKRIYKESIRSLEKKKAKLQDAKERGFENILNMEWGDNHGHVSGGNTGYAMDYEGRTIRINSDDLIVFTEQNR